MNESLERIDCSFKRYGEETDLVPSFAGCIKLESTSKFTGYLYESNDNGAGMENIWQHDLSEARFITGYLTSKGMVACRILSCNSEQQPIVVRGKKTEAIWMALRPDGKFDCEGKVGIAIEHLNWDKVISETIDRMKNRILQSGGVNAEWLGQKQYQILEDMLRNVK